MSIWELLLISVSLAMDAFAVSVCKGLASKAEYIKTGLACGIWFGVFQALMPFLGWLLASTVSSYIDKISAYIAFALLTFLGVKTIVESWRERGTCAIAVDADGKTNSLHPRIMLAFAIATSIDALAAGITFAVMSVNIAIAVLYIGVVTFLFCFTGAAIGAKIGAKCKTGAGIAGGIILIALGMKFLVEHLLSL